MLILPTQFPIARYRFEFVVAEEMLLPAYSGSTLRGIFGHALRHVACMTRAPKCHGCPLLTTCPYSEIFETPVPNDGTFSKNQNVPQSYIIEPPDIGERHFKEGDLFQFEMVLFGKALSRIALINFAWQKALERGIRSGGKAEFIDVKIQTERGYESVLDGEYVIPHTQVLSLPKSVPTDLTIEFETPMRLQHKGRVLSPETMRSDLFLMQLLRRFSWMSEVHFGKTLAFNYSKLKQLASKIEQQADLRWYDWTRYSNRQQQKMHLGGVLGQWVFLDIPPIFSQLLYLGQWLHAGKNTTFGLGKYRIINK